MRSAHVLAVVLLAPVLSAQVAISEVLVDPRGPNKGHQIIEIINTTGSTFEPDHWTLLTSSGMTSLPNRLPPGASTLQVGGLELNEADFWVNLPMLESAGTITLLGEMQHEDRPRVIVDFVSWGGGTTRITDAVAVGQWDDTNATVRLPSEGHTIAWLGKGDGSGTWYADSTPTIGRPNDAARYGDEVGQGCPGSAGTPGLTAITLPWTGSVFSVAITNLPGFGHSSFGVMTTGLETEKPALDLTSFGLPGCILHVKIVANSFFPVYDTVGLWHLTIPDLPSIVGLRFFNQALVQDTAADNIRGAILSKAVSGVIGDK